MGDKPHFAGKIPVLDTHLLMKEFWSPRPLLLGEVTEILLKIPEETLVVVTADWVEPVLW